MKLLIYALILLGTLGIALHAVVKRWAVKSRSSSHLFLYLAMSFGISSILFGIIFLAGEGSHISRPSLLPGFFTAVLITAAANIFIQFLNTKAASLAAGEVSLTAPLQAMTPLLITVAALLLGETPGMIGVAGIACMSLGSFVLLAELRATASQQWYEYIRPFRVLSTLAHWQLLGEKEKDKAKAVLLSIGSACLGTIGLLFDGLYTRRGVDWRGLTLGSVIVTTILGFTYFSCFLFQANRDRESQVVPLRLIAGAAMGGALWVAIVYLIYPAFNVEYVAYVGTLKRFSILMSGVLGWWLFNEQNIKQRLWAASLVTVGALLLSFDNLPARISTHIEGWGL